MAQAALQNFDPTKLIVPAKVCLRGWRKTVKITAPGGEKMTITTGEGPMFEEESESEPQSEPEFELSIPESFVLIKSLPHPLLQYHSKFIMSQPSEEFLNDLQLFDVMFNEFNNKASSSSYLPCLPIDCNNDNYCFSNEQDDKEIIKAVEEYENKTPIIEKTETVNLSPNPDVKREVQIGLTLDQDE